MKIAAKIVAGIGLAVLASACTPTIFKHKDLDALQVVTTGAKQRAILSASIDPASQPGLVDPQRINCTEPSPDVANAIANSFSTGIGILGQGSGSLSASQVETMAQLVERTASIQLLRDKMYQTCLAYANGAISGTMYNLVMTKLDNTIVSLLLGESAAGRFGASLATAGGDTSGEASATLIGLPAGVEDLSGLTDELKAAQADVDASEKAYAQSKKIADADKATDDEKQAAKDAKTDLDNAKTKRDEILNRLQSRADTLAKTGAKSANVAAVGSIGNAGGPASAEVLLAMQKEFLGQGLQDFVITGCFAELGLTSQAQYQLARGETLDVLAAQRESGQKAATLLADFCLDFLNGGGIVATLTNQKEISIQRSKDAKDVSLARAKAISARALAAEHKAFVARLAACDKLPTDPMKEKCRKDALGMTDGS